MVSQTVNIELAPAGFKLELPPALILKTGESGSAVFDRSNRYRYLLVRELESGQGALAFIMLNPSAADESFNDPTIKRCIGFAKAWQFKHLLVGNLFAWKSGEPERLKAAKEPTGSFNDEFIGQLSKAVCMTVAAWGNHGAFLGRDCQVISTIAASSRLVCLGTTRSGMPRHPLYVASGTAPQSFPVK